MSRWVILAAVLGAVVAGGCSTNKPAGSAEQRHGRILQVVATTTQVADFARNLGGDRVQVTSLLKPNLDAHDFEPSPADVEAIARADLVVKNGAGLESWLHDTITNSGFDGPLVDTSQGVRLRQVGGAIDPHIWQNPRNAEVMVANIDRAFAAADPADARVFRANLAGYTKQLQALDAEVQRVGASYSVAHATCTYSRISPPSRSRRTTVPADMTTAGSLGLSGGSCPKARCGRCSL